MSALAVACLSQLYESEYVLHRFEVRQQLAVFGQTLGRLFFVKAARGGSQDEPSTGPLLTKPVRIIKPELR